MDMALNKNEVENMEISLSFVRIRSFDELLYCNLDDVVYIHDSEDEYPKIFLKNNKIVKKKMFFGKRIYFKLNDSVCEPTKLDRDNFNLCSYVFYKLKLNLKDKNGNKQT
jgi:hypothetical protein